MLRGTGLESDIRWNNQGQVSTRYPLCAEERSDKPAGRLLMTEKGKGEGPDNGLKQKEINFTLIF
jgi:hypothetical protein